MWRRDRELDDRLRRIEEALGRLARDVAELRAAGDLTAENAELRREVERQRERVGSLARQGLQVIELLDDARREAAGRRRDERG